MKGKLYGVGVGPGDPQLMTLKAVRVIAESPVIAVPSDKKESCVAYRIAAGAADLSGKEWLEIPMPMTRDPAKLEQAHAAGAARIAKVLAAGRQVAFLTLGDPAVYATYVYLQRCVAALGYETETVSGVPSFCAAAARLNIPLAERGEELHIIPAGYDAEDALRLPGTKVFLKAGSGMGALKGKLQQMEADVYMVENCGMENEKIYKSAADMDAGAGYYSLVVVKEGRGDRA